MSDHEGRVIQMEFGDLRLINAYFPSGTSGEERGFCRRKGSGWIDYINMTKPLQDRLCRRRSIPRSDRAITVLSTWSWQ